MGLRQQKILMASQKVQYLCCAASPGISRTNKYAGSLGICAPRSWTFCFAISKSTSTELN